MAIIRIYVCWLVAVHLDGCTGFLGVVSGFCISDSAVFGFCIACGRWSICFAPGTRLHDRRGDFCCIGDFMAILSGIVLHW